MTHPYPPHDPRLPYVGKYHYFLTFCTDDRRVVFTDQGSVELVIEQILRAAERYGFAITAYCFMPDHLHLLIRGATDGSDCRAFIKAAKQYSAFHFKRQRQAKLWQRYGYERVVRDDMERATTIRYILDNPVDAGLATDPADYPFLGSQSYTVAELVQQAAPSP